MFGQNSKNSFERPLPHCSVHSKQRASKRPEMLCAGLQNHSIVCSMFCGCVVTIACCAGPDIHHFDLYRLDSTASLGRLQLEQSFQDAVSLVEWAERLPMSMRPDNRLDIQISPVQVRDSTAHWPDTRISPTHAAAGADVLPYCCLDLASILLYGAVNGSRTGSKPLLQKI